MEAKLYCYKTEALKILGLTHGQFKKLGLKPIKIIRNPAWQRGWVHLFDKPFIESLMNDPRVVSLRTGGRVPETVRSGYYEYTKN